MIVNMRPCKRSPQSHSRQCVDCSDPTYQRARFEEDSNPTNGSWWIVQVQPTNHHSSNLTLRAENDPGFSTTCWNSALSVETFERLLSRLDLNDPRTAVRGIRKVLKGVPL
jgi:hypothetical protein